MLLGIVIALGTGLYGILFKKEKSEIVIKALTVRIGLSLTLFLLLILAVALGWIKPHHLFIEYKPAQKELTTPHPQNANTTPLPQKQNGAPE